MNPNTHRSISVSARFYAVLTAARASRGQSITEIVEAALAGTVAADAPAAPAVPVSAEVYRAVGKIARRNGEPMADVLDRAITQLLDDAARWIEPPGKSRRTYRTPRVDHASRPRRVA